MKDQTIFRSVVYFYFIAIAAVLLFWSILKDTVTVRGNYDIAVVTSFVAIGFFSVVFLVQAVLRCGISLCVIHWYFVLIFFFIVPFLQYLGNLFLHRVESDSILIGNIYILLWCLLYGFAYNYSIKKISETSGALSPFSGQGLRPGVLKLRFYVLTLASVAVAVWLISIGGIESFYTRGSYNTLLMERVGGWKPRGFMIAHYLRPLLFFIFVLFIGIVFLFRKIKKTPAIYLCLFILLITNIIINNPISHTRFMLFTITFGLFVLFSLRKVKSSLIYISALFLGVPMSFILDIFRRPYTNLSRGQALTFNWDFVFLHNFDSYENFVHTISHVSRAGIVYGRQLAGALLFFVPRAFWTGKPIGSGAYIAGFLERKFEVTHFNVGNPLISEMYLNFHIIGIIAGALLYGFITGRLDKHYWLSLEKDTLGRNRHQRNADFYRLLYPFLLGPYLVHLRGDFMSSFAYGVAIVMAFVTVVMFLKLRVAR